MEPAPPACFLLLPPAAGDTGVLDECGDVGDLTCSNRTCSEPIPAAEPTAEPALEPVRPTATMVSSEMTCEPAVGPERVERPKDNRESCFVAALPSPLVGVAGSPVSTIGGLGLSRDSARVKPVFELNLG